MDSLQRDTLCAVKSYLVALIMRQSHSKVEGAKKKKRAKVGVLNATLEFYFGCFFSCKTDYGAGCNTKDCQCITSYSHPKLNRAQDGVHSGILGRRCDCGLNNSQAVKHGGEGEGEGDGRWRGVIYTCCH